MRFPTPSMQFNIAPNESPADGWHEFEFGWAKPDEHGFPWVFDGFEYGIWDEARNEMIVERDGKAVYKRPANSALNPSRSEIFNYSPTTPFKRALKLALYDNLIQIQYISKSIVKTAFLTQQLTEEDIVLINVALTLLTVFDPRYEEYANQPFLYNRHLDSLLSSEPSLSFALNLGDFVKATLNVRLLAAMVHLKALCKTSERAADQCTALLASAYERLLRSTKSAIDAY